MPRYIEVVHATHETASKILALRAGALRGTKREIVVTTNGGRTASVIWSDDLSKIVLNMPSLPPDANLNRAEADRLVAFIVHECCHCLHSDKSAWALAVKAGARVRDWTNALEDVRIEAKEIKAGAFPAMGGLLASMANHLHYESVVDAAKHGRVIGAAIADAPYVAAILGRMANGYAIPAAAGLWASMSPNVQQLLTLALDQIRTCRTTDDVRHLAGRLVAMEQGMRPQQDKPEKGDGEPEKGDDEPQDGQDGQDGQDDDDASGEPQEGQDGDDASGAPQEGQDGDDASGEPQEGQDGDPEGACPINTDADLASTIDKIAERAGAADLNTQAVLGGAHVLSTVRSTITTAAESDHYASEHAVASGELNQRLPRNSVLHGQIGRLLVSAEVRRVTHHESAGRLDRRALSRMRAGATDVFSRRDDQPGVDTALLILIDGSSSMVHRDHRAIDAAVAAIGRHATLADARAAVPSRMMVAQCAAWHIAKAAEAAGAKVCLAAFRSPRDPVTGKFVTEAGADVIVVKPWDQPVADRAAHLAAVDPNGGTPLSPAILAGADMLAGVNATRHILMCVTDGECDLGPDAVTRACTLAGDHGVETVGVGMQCASVTAAFPPRYSVNVEDLAQLAAKGLGVLVAMLEDANPRGGAC